MTKELYKVHRPRTLEKVIGAEQTCQALRNMLDKGTLPHTLLFTGPSGCGKTTLARILKTELQCHEMDFRELNCSDFRGIDTIREIARQMHLAPTGGKCRIWLLDEVHQLSKDGQNAALKILEDTPAHVYFFLCTTDPQKLLKTILTRCTEMPVRALSYPEIEGLVQKVCKREKIELTKDVLDELVGSANGSARTALVLLDKIANLKADQQVEALQQKLKEENEAIELCRLLMKKADWSQVAKCIKGLTAEPESVRRAVLGYAASVLLNKNDWQAFTILQAFDGHFYDTGKPGLVRACYDAIVSK